MTSTTLTLSLPRPRSTPLVCGIASAGWVFASDWHDPAVDALCEACLRRENIWAPAERLGMARAAAGASLGETLADVDGLTAVLPEVSPTNCCTARCRWAGPIGWRHRRRRSSIR